MRLTKSYVKYVGMVTNDAWPRTRHQIIDDRTFLIAATHVWNRLSPMSTSLSYHSSETLTLNFSRDPSPTNILQKLTIVSNTIKFIRERHVSVMPLFFTLLNYNSWPYFHLWCCYVLAFRRATHTISCSTHCSTRSISTHFQLLHITNFNRKLSVYYCTKKYFITIHFVIVFFCTATRYKVVWSII